MKKLFTIVALLAALVLTIVLVTAHTVTTRAVSQNVTRTSTASVPVVTSVPSPTPKVTAKPTPKKVEKKVPAQTQIEEDDPQWDCATMGNKICGNAIPEKEVKKEIAKKEIAKETPHIAKAAPVNPPEVPSIPPLWGPMPALSEPCDNLELGDAHAGTGYICNSLKEEAIRFNNFNYIPTDEFCDVTYIGISNHDSTNGDDLYSVQSEFMPDFWHTYRIVEKESHKHPVNP